MSFASSLFGPQSRAPRPASNVPNYKRQMVAATQPYSAPSIPQPPAYPAGGATLLGALDGAHEADSAAHLQRQLDPYSPMARHRQDAAQADRVASLAQGIAGHRQMVDGPWGQSIESGPPPVAGSLPAKPYPQATLRSNLDPRPIGVRVGPPRRIGVQGPIPQARLASATTPTPPARGGPHAYGPVVPGADYTPTAIEPVKNTWRPDQGSPSFNWRTHPGMVELDAATLKAHPYQESRSLRGPNAGYGGPAGGQPATILDALAAGVQRQAADAAGRSDLDGMARAMGSLDALRNNGAAGLLDFGHKAAMQDSQREQAGARIGVLDRTNPGARIGIYTSPEQARDAVTAKTGDPAMGQQAMQTQRLTEAVQAARSGQAFNLDPNDAQAYLEQYHPAIAPKFRVDEGGVASVGHLSNLYDYLSAVKPPGWDDPASMLGRTIGLRVPQIYGEKLVDELAMPPSPSQIRKETWGPNGPEAYLPSWLAGPVGAVGDWAGGVVMNAEHGNPTLRPGNRHASLSPSINWFNRLTQPQR